jgi:hypothetical protein
LDNYTLQVCGPDDKWYWIVVDEWAGDYLVASPTIENDVVWFNYKSDVVEYIASVGISPGSEVLLLQDDGNDLSIKITKVRIVKVEAVEV